MSVLNDMETAGDRARYDENAKILLSNKSVLARVLKLAVPEYEDEPVEAIEGYIHDGVRVGVVALDANVRDLDHYTVGHRILPLAQESNDMKSGRVTFDIVFTVDLPGDKARKNQLYIFVNIEQQLDFDPDYPVPSRSVYYLARQISLQKGTVFEGEDYGKIKKCYSIWLCPDAERKRASFISIMDFNMKAIYGKSRFRRSSYDKMAAIFCSFQPGEEGNELLKFLDTLFSQEKTLEERRRILEEEYGIKDDEIEGTMWKMCNLSEGIYNSGVSQGEDTGEDRVSEYIAKLANEGNMEEIIKVTTDKDYRKKVLAEAAKKKESATT